MKVDLEKIKLGHSSMSDSVYAGTVNAKSKKWINKIDVTNDFLACVIARFGGFREEIQSEDGKIYEIMVKEIPVSKKKIKNRTSMNLPKEAMERLGLLADDLSQKIWNTLPLAPPYKPSVCCEMEDIIHKALVAEAERAQKRVKALQTIRKDVKGEPNLLDIIDTTLNEYNAEIKQP